MNRLLTIIILFSISFLFINSNDKPRSATNADELIKLLEVASWYNAITDSAGLSKAALYYAYEGFLEMSRKELIENDTILTIVDYSKPSDQERLYVIDLKDHKLIVRSLVAHGQNSGLILATRFSNQIHSHMSSLGLFLTTNTYKGKHGYSLRLDGMEKGINDNARKRAIVIHGANYVNNAYLEEHGRIGRSYGCPALPGDLSAKIIDLIKDGSCFYIYHPSIVKL